MYRTVYLLVIAALVGADRLSKYLIINSSVMNGDIKVIPGIINFSYVENTGAAFSLFSGGTYVLAALTGVIIAFGLVILMRRRLKPVWLEIAALSVVAGGIGNLIDRLSLGYVIDFIEFDFVSFAVFNFADCLVTFGVLMLVVYFIRDAYSEKKLKKNITDGGESGHTENTP